MLTAGGSEEMRRMSRVIEAGPLLCLVQLQSMRGTLIPESATCC